MADPADHDEGPGELDSYDRFARRLDRVARAENWVDAVWVAPRGPDGTMAEASHDLLVVGRNLVLELLEEIDSGHEMSDQAFTELMDTVTHTLITQPYDPELVERNRQLGKHTGHGPIQTPVERPDLGGVVVSCIAVNECPMPSWCSYWMSVSCDHGQSDHAPCMLICWHAIRRADQRAAEQGDGS